MNDSDRLREIAEQLANRFWGDDETRAVPDSHILRAVVILWHPTSVYQSKTTSEKDWSIANKVASSMLADGAVLCSQIDEKHESLTLRVASDIPSTAEIFLEAFQSMHVNSFDYVDDVQDRHRRVGIIQGVLSPDGGWFSVNDRGEIRFR